MWGELIFYCLGVMTPILIGVYMNIDRNKELDEKIKNYFEEQKKLKYKTKFDQKLFEDEREEEKQQEEQNKQNYYILCKKDIIGRCWNCKREMDRQSGICDLCVAKPNHNEKDDECACEDFQDHIKCDNCEKNYDKETITFSVNKK